MWFLIKYAVFHPIRTVVIIVAGVMLGIAGFYALQIQRTFDAVASEQFDPVSARFAIGETPEGPEDDLAFGALGELAEIDDLLDHAEPSVQPPVDPKSRFPAAFGTPIPDGVFEAYLFMGVDASGFLADAIILVLEPTAGGSPVMVSLPRDLWVWNMCLNRFTRLNQGLAGCRSVASGSELMAIMVEDYTGIKVDHLARVDFDGFIKLVDTMGGVTVCVDHPSRDFRAGLDIPEAGCHLLGGPMALAWVRSRNTEQLIDGEWRVTVGSDFVRQRRQQDVMFQLAAHAAGFASPGSLTETLGVVGSSLRFNSNWTLSQAVTTGWRFRGITPSGVKTFQVRVRDYTTGQGARVLVPRVSFTDQLRQVTSLPPGI